MVDGEVAALEVADDRLAGVRMADGEVVPRDALVVAPRMVARAAIPAALGAPPSPIRQGSGERVPSETAGQTGVPGVWVAGNVTDMTAQVGAAAAQGALAGAHINADLVAEETDAAVRDRARAAAGRLSSTG